MIEVSMQVGKSFSIFVSPVPSSGVLDSPPTYASDVSGSVAITPALDGLSALVSAVAPGVTTITVKDTSLGNPILGDDQIKVTVVPAPIAATALHVTVGPVS